jgi:hypothetical protein
MRVNLRRFAGSCGGYARSMPRDHDDLEQRSADLQERIDETRHQAQKDGLLPDPEPHPTFADPDADGDEEITGLQGGL